MLSRRDSLIEDVEDALRDAGRTELVYHFRSAVRRVDVEAISRIMDVLTEALSSDTPPPP